MSKIITLLQEKIPGKFTVSPGFCAIAQLLATYKCYHNKQVTILVSAIAEYHGVF